MFIYLNSWISGILGVGAIEFEYYVYLKLCMDQPINVKKDLILVSCTNLIEVTFWIVLLSWSIGLNPASILRKAIFNPYAAPRHWGVCLMNEGLVLKLCYPIGRTASQRPPQKSESYIRDGNQDDGSWSRSWRTLGVWLTAWVAFPVEGSAPLSVTD